MVPEVEEDGRLLAEAGVRCVRRGGMLAVVARNVFAPQLAAINRQQLEQQQPWLLIHPEGERVWVGPMFVPGRTGCWRCLAHRLSENRWTPSAEGWAPRTLRFAARNLASAAEVEGCIRELTPSGTATHWLTRRPQCPDCGSQRVKADPGGLDRLVSPLTGVLSEWREVASGPPLYLWRGESARGPVIGRGATRKEAKLGCVAEAIERYCMHWQGDEPCRRARRDALDGPSVSLDELLLISGRQYAGRNRWNREVGGAHRIPEPLAPDAEIDWSAAWSLTRKKAVYVPAAYCYLRYPADWCFADSNGCAAGSTAEHAMRNGLLELVERDAAAIWWGNGIIRPVVRPRIPFVERAERELRSRGRTLALLDLTTDLDIPVYAAVSRRRDGRQPLFAHAAGLDAAEACCRAVSELFQVIYAIGEAELIPAGLPHLTGVGEAVLDRRTRCISYRDELDMLVERVRLAGVEVLALDITRADIGLPVFRMIAPGLRPLWKRLAPGRLFEAPRKMGWRRNRHAIPYPL